MMPPADTRLDQPEKAVVGPLATHPPLFSQPLTGEYLCRSFCDCEDSVAILAPAAGRFAQLGDGPIVQRSGFVRQGTFRAQARPLFWFGGTVGTREASAALIVG